MNRWFISDLKKAAMRQFLKKQSNTLMILPRSEEIGQALRREVRVYPEIAIRELVASPLIHQDFNLTENGPTIKA